MNDNEAELMIEHNRRVYDVIATDYARKRSPHCEEFQFLTDYCRPGDRVLDLGCGSGRLYSILEKFQVDYVGVDQSEEQIKIAKEKFPALKFICSEMSALPIQDNYLDLIYCLRSFHHLPTAESRIKALREMKRVLKMGGTIVLVNWNLYSEWGRKKFPEIRVDQDGDIMVPWKDNAGKVLGERYYHGLTVAEMERLFHDAGLKTKEKYFIRKNVKCGIEDGEDLVMVAVR
ncbi:MAG: class I SAM-dependent methyltransferase [Patescibacteria group bacterium]